MKVLRKIYLVLFLIGVIRLVLPNTVYASEKNQNGIIIIENP